MAKEVWVAKEAVLRSPEHLHALAKRMKEMKISRMGGFLFLLETLMEWDQSGGIVRDASGKRIVLHDNVIEDAYAWETFFSWNSDFLVFADRMPLRCAGHRMVPRLQLWDAALRIYDRRYF